MTNPEEFSPLGAATLRDTVRWFDAQGSRVAAGVLVLELRRGGKPGWTPAGGGGVDAQRAFGEEICGWLTQHFPDLCDPKWGPHPAAYAAVSRLRYQHGKGSLTKREHGPAIRTAVQAFDEKWIQPTEASA